MHDTARWLGREFFTIYGQEAKSVLDVGSCDVNGTLREFVPWGAEYIGVDVSAGPNVSLVLDDPYKIPLENDSFDLVISTSTLEHTEFFWLTFLEMVRVVRPGGFIYVNAPVQGAVHRHPVDCWRFYPDAGRALCRWAEHNGWPIKLVESFLGPLGEDGWIDFVAVWSKPPLSLPKARIAWGYPVSQAVMETMWDA